MEPPPAPKKKPKFFVHWNRRKPRFYDYNWDYGDNYYSNLVKYMDNRSGGNGVEVALLGRLSGGWREVWWMLLWRLCCCEVEFLWCMLRGVEVMLF